MQKDGKMTYYIIIRGPLGIGKTTIAKKLAKEINAEHISIDKILEENGLDKINNDYIPEDFIKANEIVLPKVKQELAKGYVFNLKAPLKTCIARDKARKRVYGEDAARAVYKLVSGFDYGINIDTENKTEEEVVNEIKKRLRCQPKNLKVLVF